MSKSGFYRGAPPPLDPVSTNPGDPDGRRVDIVLYREGLSRQGAYAGLLLERYLCHPKGALVVGDGSGRFWVGARPWERRYHGNRSNGRRPTGPELERLIMQLVGDEWITIQDVADQLAVTVSAVFVAMHDLRLCGRLEVAEKIHPRSDSSPDRFRRPSAPRPSKPPHGPQVQRDAEPEEV